MQELADFVSVLSGKLNHTLGDAMARAKKAVSSMDKTRSGTVSANEWAEYYLHILEKQSDSHFEAGFVKMYVAGCKKAAGAKAIAEGEALRHAFQPYGLSNEDAVAMAPELVAKHGRAVCLRGIFAMIDQNQDGELDVQELADFVSVLSGASAVDAMARAKKAVSSMDKIRSGTVSANEWAEYYLRLLEKQSDSHFEAGFIKMYTAASRLLEGMFILRN